MVEFVESKLTEHGVEKLIPEDGVLEEHARHVLEQRFAKEAFEPLLAQVRERAKKEKLPADLARRVRDELKKYRYLPWDLAVANVMREKNDNAN
jgi:hypothetical protein